VLRASPIVLNRSEKKILIDKFSEKIIDGNALAQKIKTGLKEHITDHSQKRGSKPMLGHLIVGELA
jgi:5,10-methylene-tetrahydrofolate dehydrogenase/methenyl tetrahydrofolate cyclohydrolase